MVLELHSWVQVCNRSAELTTKPEPNVLYFQSSLLLAEQMTNKFQIPNRDFVIWVLEFYYSTWPHYPHKLMGSGSTHISSKGGTGILPVVSHRQDACATIRIFKNCLT